jgi:transcriptional regulator with XRE-family HTH domain
VQDLRSEGGKWIRERREAAGLTQSQLSALVGARFPSYVSQIENGRGRIPSDQYVSWANALGLRPRHFVREVLRFFDPITHAVLFDGNSEQQAELQAHERLGTRSSN